MKAHLKKRDELEIRRLPTPVRVGKEQKAADSAAPGILDTGAIYEETRDQATPSVLAKAPPRALAKACLRRSYYYGYLGQEFLNMSPLQRFVDKAIVARQMRFRIEM
eukprot:TRINITY_DN5909_c0_g1_i1.p1 TRINITY_DN5909_c0_g1~~TRINITY_DN5909_c0_g1_i1.p1  ORF type:complete len:107 (+),score=25.87 TRINITY_DN5909_c0_g1_i1:223-543(+)